jgi:hypothetical protein
MGAPDKVVQRILRHSKPHVTKEHYIKVFDRTVVEAVEKMQAQIEELRKAKGDRQQLELRFDGDQQATTASECSSANGFRHLSTARPANFFKLRRKQLNSCCCVCRQDSTLKVLAERGDSNPR